MAHHSGSRPASPELRLSTATAPHTGPTTGTVSPHDEQHLPNPHAAGAQHSNVSTNPAARRGRVHWDGNAGHVQSAVPGAGLSLGGAGVGGAASASGARRVAVGGGATISVRGAGLAGTGRAPGGGLQLAHSGSVTRRHHPGPLQLSARLANAQPPMEAMAPESAPAAEPHRHVLREEVNGPLTAAAPAALAPPVLVLTGAKGLDEQGLDSRAFLELQRELQRHEAVGENVFGEEEPHDLPSMAEVHAQAPQRRRHATRRIDTPDWASSASGASTPGTGDWTSDSGSYDPAADSDLDHIDLVPGEVDGMPSRPRRRRAAQQEDEEEKPKGWARLRNILRPTHEQDDDEKGLPMTERRQPLSHEEGGPTNTKSVPVTTSSGTRAAGSRSRPSKYEREAARLIKAHRLMTGSSSADDAAVPAGLGRIPSLSRKHLDSHASTPDALETSANLDARPVASGGVLGNLLRLYEQQQRQAAQEKHARVAGLESGATSPLDSSPHERLLARHAHANEDESNLSELVAAELAREQSAKPSPARTGPSERNSARRQHAWSVSSRASPGAAASYGAAIVHGSTKVARATKSVAAVAAREAGLDDAVDDRPKASRSAGGVIGGLVATTGNLIGAVSPAHAQLGPNPKRAGFTLDRYLLPEMNAKTLRKTAEIVADAAPRPRKSAPGTPGGALTSGTTSPTQHESDATLLHTPDGAPHAQAQYKTKSRPSSIMFGHAGTADSHMAATHSRKGSHLHMPAFAQYWTKSLVNTPDANAGLDAGDYFGAAGSQNGAHTDEMEDRLHKIEWQRKLKKRAKAKRKKEEIFITMHVAAILQRQEFLLKLARALMMFGAPTHRIETQIQQTARVLEINCRCIYLPNLMLLAFGDDATHTSETKFIKQGGGLDLQKLTDMHAIYWNVIHDKVGVAEASAQLDELMRRKPLIGLWPMVFIGGFCSAFICVGDMGFSGSFIDALAAFPLGMFLVFCQSVITTELFSNVFEIVFAAINSFVASALASTSLFCYSAVVSGSIVLILPGFIVLSGSLELQSKNLIAGSVRLVYAIIYSLFLGFGISIGSSFWLLFRGSSDSTPSYLNCSDPLVHPANVWYRRTVPIIWALLTVPGYSMALALRNQAKVNRKEFPVMIAIACAGWACNHYSSTAPALKNRQDITSALGSLCVGLLANIYGRCFDGRAFVVAVPGILYQLPSGLSNGGLLNFANTGEGSSSTSNFNSGFQVAQSLVEVAIGLTVGLFAATMISYVTMKKVRGGGLFSF